MHHLLFASGRRYQSVSAGKQGKLWRIHSGRDAEYPGAGSGAASEDDNLLYDYGMPAKLYSRLFWEQAKELCGNCSNCLEELEEMDATEAAADVIECVRESGQRFG